MEICTADAEAFEFCLAICSIHFFLHQEGSANCTHDFVMGRNNNLSSQFLLENLGNSLIESNTSLKHNRWQNLLT